MTPKEDPPEKTPITEAPHKASSKPKHSKVTPPNGWGDPRSYLTSSTDKNGLTHIRGNYFYNNCDFKFSLVEQKNNKNYLFRGRISPISAADGQILQLRGKARAEKLEALTKNSATDSHGISIVQKSNPHESSNSPSNLRRRIPELNITSEINVNSKDISSVKDAVSKAALKLYETYGIQMHHIQGKVARPDTITPAVAAFTHVDAYLRTHHKKIKEGKSLNNYRRMIVATCSQFPHIPMCQFTVQMVKRILSEKPFSQQAVRLTSKFWAYCLALRICEGICPFPEERVVKTTPETNQTSLNRRTELSLSEQDNLFDLLHIHHSGGDCGIALQLWGGCSATTAVKLTWEKVIFCSGHPDYVRIKIRHDDRAGATHNYTRPLFPAGALILLARHEELLAQYTPKQLSKMPVVSCVSNPKKAMKSDDLVRYSTKVLRSIGITDILFAQLRRSKAKIAASRRLLSNTYVKNITTRCGIKDDAGTIAFLIGGALKNVSDDNYTAFSDEEGNARLHTIISAVQPLFDLDQPPDVTLLENGTELHQFAPDTTRERVKVSCAIQLAPGEKIIVRCSHGITGDVQARGLRDDGKPRRKTQKNSK